MTNVSVMAQTGGDVAVEPERRVDAVRQQVAGDSRAGRGGIEPPEARAALRQVGRDRPVLEEVGAVVEDPAEPARRRSTAWPGSRRGRGGSCTRRCSGRLAFSTAWTISGPRPGSSRAASRRGPSCPPWPRRSRSRRGCCSGVQMSIASMSLRATSFRQSVSTDS